MQTPRFIVSVSGFNDMTMTGNKLVYIYDPTAVRDVLVLAVYYIASTNNKITSLPTVTVKTT